MSSNMDKLKVDFPELYDTAAKLNDTVYSGRVLSQKEQKIIAIALTAGSCNEVATRKQMENAIKYYDVNKDEIMDALGIVLIMNGKPAFTKAVGVLYSLLE